MNVALAKLEPRTVVLVMAGVVALVAALAFRFAVWPQVKLYQQSVKQRTALSRVVAGGSDLAQQLDEVENEVKALDASIHGDMANLPEKQLEAFVMGRLQGISSRNNVRLLSVTPRSGESVKVFREALFDVTLSGTYNDLFDWLHDLSGELGFVVVRQYSIEATGNQTDDPELNARVTIVSYRQAEGA